MNLRVLSKIVFLLVALSATVFAVFQLNTGHMNDFWTSLGIGKSTHSLNWCSNRLVSLAGKKGEIQWELKEQDRKWVIVKNGTDTRILEYLDIEKWLAKYCILDIAENKDHGVLDMPVESIAAAKFNDGNLARLFKLGDKGIYQINEMTFTSSEFEQALKDLYDLLKI